ncbi:MAG: alpha/beta hydrolase [Treponema sp.]|nr:alpha/beta hydrolase [Treponema sp.]
MVKKHTSLSNGEVYAYIEKGIEFKTGSEAILLIHGNSSSSLHFLPLVNRLTNNYVVAPDLRGFGDSSYNNRFSSLAELAEDVKLFTEALGIKKAHLVGWSTGGGIAFELALKYPDLISSLFIIQGAGHKGYPLYNRKEDGSFVPFASKEELACDPVLIIPVLTAIERKDEAFISSIWDASIYVKNKPTPEENKIYITETLKQRNLVDLDWALVNFNIGEGHNGYSQGTNSIGMIKCPVTFTSAALDAIVPPATIRENADAIRGSIVLEYKDSGHSVLVDNPDTLTADILEHIEKTKHE